MSPEGNPKKLPTLFLSHGGGPWSYMEDPDGHFTRLAEYLRGIPSTLSERPKALLVISGHWEEDQFTVMGNPKPGMIYDYYGFPEHTYRIRYPAPGSPELARQVKDLLDNAGFPCGVDPERGYDHGVYAPLFVTYPQADMPIVQLSIKHDMDPATHLAMGRALAPLRSQGILIVASGLSYHNLRAFGPRGKKPSEEFDAWLGETLGTPDAEERERKLMDWSKAPSARAAHPREDHLIPLMVVVGAAGSDVAKRVYDDEVFGVKVSGYQFGD